MIEIFQVIDNEIPAVFWGIKINTESKIATFIKDGTSIKTSEVPQFIKEVLSKMVIRGSSLVGVPLPT